MCSHLRFLDRLEVPDLALEDDAQSGGSRRGLNPYDTGKLQPKKLDR
jgi:hypothetical protein